MGLAYEPVFCWLKHHSSQENDACGVGFLASIDGKPNRKVVTSGIEALKAVWHRGAIDADGKTGDGAGIHLEIPKSFFEEEINEVDDFDFTRYLM